MLDLQAPSIRRPGAPPPCLSDQKRQEEYCLAERYKQAKQKIWRCYVRPVSKMYKKIFILLSVILCLPWRLVKSHPTSLHHGKSSKRKPRSE